MNSALEPAPDSWAPGGKPDPLTHRRGRIGAAVARIDGPLNVQGKATFAAEFALDNMVHAALVFSTIAKGRNATLDTSAAEAAPGVVLVITHRDAPRMRPTPLFGSSEKAGGSEELRRRDLARQAVLSERGRIARELHDVVAHYMSMIAIQAEATPHKAPDLPRQTQETLTAIQTAAREALAETRRVVGLLRDDPESPERDPRPGLDQLDDLLESARQSGLDVNAAVLGVPKGLPAGVDLSAYRIVQESLSNAARYAPGARVRVEVGYGDDQLRVAVTDDGAAGAGAPAAEPGGGHGLVGMRERVAMLGGAFSAGRRDEGGFEVDAELPYGHGGREGDKRVLMTQGCLA